MSADLSECGWSADRLGELLGALAARHGLTAERVKNPPISSHLDDREKVNEWIETACEFLGVEAQASSIGYADIENLLKRGAPAVLRCAAGDETYYLGLLASGRRHVALLDPRGESVGVPIQTVRRWLCDRLEGPLEPEIDEVLERAGVATKRATRARRLMLNQRLSGALLGGLWLLRPAPSSRFREQLRQAGVLPRLAALTATHAAQYALWILSWWTMGFAALGGRVDPGMLVLWVLMVLSLIPFRMATTWLQGSISIRGGAALKQRLLSGALRLAPEEVRHQGAGQLLAKVLESSALEQLALSGGFLTLLGGIEILLAAAVLTQGAGGWPHALVLLVWIGVAYLAGRAYLARRTRWTEERLDLTNALVESMLGYRTRLAQEARGAWHQNEDRQIDGYSRESGRLDRAAMVLGAVISRGWGVVGIAALGPALVAGTATPATLAIALGGVLLASRSLAGFTSGMAQLYGAGIAWRQTAELFWAAARPQAPSEPDLVMMRDRSESRALVEAQEIAFSYEGRAEPVIRNCDLEISRGDRVLFLGPSGAGKSTLASLLAGLRSPSSGLMLLRGLDQASAGLKFWRRSIVLAPQFHENHVLNESLAFNILMGRNWPPHRRDLEEAEEVCRQLGLGDLLDRMPSGLFQMVGETGWQLSHGERSRVFIARTLMQEHDLTILDESFGGLDGESVLGSAKVLLERAPTVAVIGHS